LLRYEYILAIQLFNTKFVTFFTCYCFEKAQKHANSTFTKDQEIFIIEQFSIFMSQSAVKRQNISIIVEI